MRKGRPLRTVLIIAGIVIALLVLDIPALQQLSGSVTFVVEKAA